MKKRDICAYFLSLYNLFSQPLITLQVSVFIIPGYTPRL